MFKGKRWILLLVILFPSLFWVILESSTINSHKLPYYGPKTAQGTDTVYYQTGLQFKDIPEGNLYSINTNNQPINVLMFIRSKYKKEGYRLEGLVEFVKYKYEKISNIPFYIICENDSSANLSLYKEVKHIIGDKSNFIYLQWNSSSFDSLNKVYFKDKPYYVDYSFVLLTDRDKHIRGYYDSRYVAEIKRLTEEYRHIRLKEEKETILKENEIKQD